MVRTFSWNVHDLYGGYADNESPDVNLVNMGRVLHALETGLGLTFVGHDSYYENGLYYQLPARWERRLQEDRIEATDDAENFERYEGRAALNVDDDDEDDDLGIWITNNLAEEDFEDTPDQEFATYPVTVTVNGRLERVEEVRRLLHGLGFVLLQRRFWPPRERT